MNSLQFIDKSKQLPDTLPELAQFALIGREKLASVRAEIRAIEKIGLANEVREQKLREGQEIGEIVLDAEVRIGELMAAIPTKPGKRTDLEPVPNAEHRSKKKLIKDAGFSVSQVQRFETLAKHPDIIAQVKAEARKKEEIVSRTSALRAIAEERKPYIYNNSGNWEYYTAEIYIKSARRVMGSIDLDPASCAFANQLVNATAYYTIQEDGLKQTWYGNIWLNPPYSITNLFVDKLIKSDFDQAILLVNNATETRWFKSLVDIASALVFPTGRVKFIKPRFEANNAPMQGQAFIYIGPDPDRFLEEFLKYGWGTKIYH